LKSDGTRAETRFRLLAKRTSSFKSAGASVQSTTGSKGVRISGSNAAYTKFRGSVKSTGYPLHSPVSPSLPFPCVTVCHHVSTEHYYGFRSVSNYQSTWRRIQHDSIFISVALRTSCLPLAKRQGAQLIARKFLPSDYLKHSSPEHLKIHGIKFATFFHVKENCASFHRTVTQAYFYNITI